MRWNPTNDETEKILSWALNGIPIPRLRAGVLFDKGTIAYRALLGTPNGRGVAWMLIQHKPEFGQKNIPQIMVRLVLFQGRWTYVMIQKIGDVSG